VLPLTCHGQEIFDHCFRRRPELGSSIQLLKIVLENIELAPIGTGWGEGPYSFAIASGILFTKQKPFWLDASVHGKGCEKNRKANFQHQN
jgi:hypothetical protein